MTQKTIYLNSFTCLVVCALSYFEGEFFPIYIYRYMNPDLEMPLGQVSIFIYLFILVSIG